MTNDHDSIIIEELSRSVEILKNNVRELQEQLYSQYCRTADLRNEYLNRLDSLRLECNEQIEEAYKYFKDTIV